MYGPSRLLSREMRPGCVYAAARGCCSRNLAFFINLISYLSITGACGRGPGITLTHEIELNKPISAQVHDQMILSRLIGYRFTGQREDVTILSRG